MDDTALDDKARAWQASRGVSDEQLEEVLRFVAEGRSKYEHAPVDFHTWALTPGFRLNSATLETSQRTTKHPGGLYPVVMEELIDINKGDYTELVCTGSIGSAKAMALDTPIPTPDGWKAIGDIQDGDTVFNELGEPVKVLMTHPVLHDQPCYEVSFGDGTRCTVSGDHLWRISNSMGRWKGWDQKVRPTEDLATRTHQKLAIDVAGPLDCQETRRLGVDPYTLGIWLGDGSSDCGRIWTVDEEVLDEIGHTYALTKQCRSEGVEPTTVHGLSRGLRQLGVLGDKHVPEAVLRGSVAQRLALLQGIVDSDGTVCRKTGRVTIVTVKERLAKGYLEVARSLGFKVTIKERRAMLMGKDCGPCWYVAWTPQPNQPVVARLPRKRAFLKTRADHRATTARHHYITSIERVDSVPVRCLTVDSSSHLYLATHSMIPTHNTTVVLETLLYQLYRLLCLRSPQMEYDLDPADEIEMVFQSISKAKARDVGYDRFKARVERSPWFRTYAKHNPYVKSQLEFPKRVVVKPVSASMTGAMGENVIGGLIDETEFMAIVESSKRAGAGTTYNQAQENYNALANRRKSRFNQVGGDLPGMLCLVSSANRRKGFIEDRAAEAKTDPRIKVYRKTTYEIAPWRYSDETFEVFVGDESRTPFVDGTRGRSIAKSDRDKGLVVEIPIDDRRAFLRDLPSALRDLAGVGTDALQPFITEKELVTGCFGSHLTALSANSTDLLYDRVNILPRRFVHRAEPRFVHIDLAATHDCAGLAMGHVRGFRRINRGQYEARGAGGEVLEHVEYEILPEIVIDFVLQIHPPAGGEIRFANVRELIYACRRFVPVTWVTADQYQSVDTLQIMRSRGYRTGRQSMDRTTWNYEMTKQALYDQRLYIPQHPVLLEELVRLEKDLSNPQRPRVDHPPDGSKDCSDALAGVVGGLSKRIEVWLRHGLTPRDMPYSIAARPKATGRDHDVEEPADPRVPDVVYR